MVRTKTLKFALCCLLVGAPAIPSGSALAQDMQLFRIGTGGIGGTYYPVGTLIARAISNPPGSPACDDPGHCGVDGLVAVAQTANGSVANVNFVADGVLESGFSQSDVAFWAWSGTGVFDDSQRLPDIRALAGLYPETVHVVARKEASIRSIRDLKGKRVSLDEPGSGTLIDARLVLEAYGLSEVDFEPQYIKPTLASEKMRAGELDAFFIVAGHPVTSVTMLADKTDITLVPIAGRERDHLLKKYPYFSAQTIGAETYEGVGEISTIGVSAVWLTRVDMDPDLIYRVTRALWNESSREILDRGHAKAREIRLENALDGLAIPLHPGAARFYSERGMLSATVPGE